MKYFLTTLLLLFLLQSSVFSQNSDRYEPILLDQEFSPYQRNIPNEFRFLVGDELTNALFNPSYLSNVANNGVHVTIHPGSNLNYRLAYLSANKWLASISFRNDFSDELYVDELFENINTMRISGNSTYFDTQMEDRFSESDRDDSFDTFELRFSRLLSEGKEKSKAIGFYFAFNGLNEQRVQNSSRIGVDTRRVFVSDTLSESSITNTSFSGISNRNLESKKLLFGLEYAHRSTDFQGKHLFFTQYNKYQYESSSGSEYIRNLERTFFDGRDSLLYFDSRIRSNKNFSNSTPWVVGYNGYFNKAMKWISEDYIFASVEGYYGFDKTDIEFSERIELLDINNGIIQSTNDVNNSLTDDNRSGYFASATLKIGYGVKVPFEDGYFFTGLSNRFQYMLTEGSFIQSNAGLTDFENSFHFFDAEIPLFGEVFLSDWFSIFGGANMKFSYSSYSYKERLSVPIYDESTGNEIDFVEKRTISRYEDLTRTYFGIKASHKSGLKLMADINGDLARLSGWYFTVGYQF